MYGAPFNIPMYHNIIYIISKRVELPVEFPINIPRAVTKNAAIEMHKTPKMLFCSINLVNILIFIRRVKINPAIKEHIS